MRSKNIRTCSSMFFLNQETNPATTSNPESKSKPRLNIKDIKPSNDIKPRYKTLPYSLIGPLCKNVFRDLSPKHHRKQLLCFLLQQLLPQIHTLYSQFLLFLLNLRRRTQT